MIKFIDLFSGIGGFHIALERLGAQCVFACEIDPHARQTYSHNFSVEKNLIHEHFASDITQVNTSDIPQFDILCAGFPCQPFSHAGKQKGFLDTRGTLFFDIARILKDKSPQAFFLENVRGLLNHDNGQTLAVIEKTIKDLGYSFHYKIIKATEFNLPQHRPRLYMVGFKDPSIHYDFPTPLALKVTMSEVWGGDCTRDIGYTLRVGGRHSPIDDRRNWDGYIVNGQVVRLQPHQAKKMQGFPEAFHFPVTERQAMKQLGNSVAINVIEAIANTIIKKIK